jgi:hypothetical protein
LRRWVLDRLAALKHFNSVTAPTQTHSALSTGRPRTVSTSHRSNTSRSLRGAPSCHSSHTQLLTLGMRAVCML